MRKIHRSFPDGGRATAEPHPERRGEFTIAEDHVTLKAGAVVKIRGEYPQVCLLPGETPVESRIEDGYTVVTLPEITGYDLFLLR